MRKSLSSCLIMLILLCLWWTSIFIAAPAAAAGNYSVRISTQDYPYRYHRPERFCRKGQRRQLCGVNAEYVYKIAQYANLNIKLSCIKAASRH
jgi:hypothetical protein